MKMVDQTTVAVFAGGKSSRFGSVKSHALINGKEFGAQIIDTIKLAGFTKIVLVGGDPEDADRWGVKFLQDLYFESGPLGALITAMRSCKTDFLMTLPCDVPYIDEHCCDVLSELHQGFEVRVAVTDSPQWLCATWRISSIDAIHAEFHGGERSIHKVIEKLKVEYVDIAEDLLININQPNQLKSR